MLDQLAWTQARNRDRRDPHERLAATSSVIATVTTSTDSLAVWNSPAFEGVTGFQSWRDRVVKPLSELVAAGALVPITTWREGHFRVRVCFDPADIGEREWTYTEWTSDPYRLLVEDGPTFLGGLESVGNASMAAFKMALEPGTYAVRTSALAWDEEPGALTEDGFATPGALPAVLITFTPSRGDELFRTSVHSYGPCNCGQ